MARSRDKLTIDIRHDKTDLVKKLIPTNVNLASRVLSKMLTDQLLLSNLAISPLFKYISEIKFTSAVKTACVDLKSRSVSINPDFFIKNVEDIRDVLFLIMHEREHVINHVKYGKAEATFKMRRHYYLLRKAGLNERFLEDVYINFSLARLFTREVKAYTRKKYIPLSVKFYTKGRRKNSLKDILLSGVLTSSTKKKIKEAFGDQALQVLEALSKKHIPLYYQFVSAFVPPDEELDSSSTRGNGEGKGGRKDKSGQKSTESEGQDNYDDSYGDNYDDSHDDNYDDNYDDSHDDDYDDSDEAEGGSSKPPKKRDKFEDLDEEFEEEIERSTRTEEHDNVDDYDDYEDLTSGSESYIFTPDKGHRASHDADGFHFLVKVSENDSELHKLATTLDGFLGHQSELTPSNESCSQQMGGAAYEIFNRLVKDIKFHGKSIIIPEKLSKKDAFFLSSGLTPVLWDIDYSPDEIKFVVYYDVSYSMYSYYHLVYSLKKILAPYISKAYQFSGFIVDDEKVPEGYFQTDSSTRIRKVLENIVKEKQKNVIIVSDFEDNVNDLNDQLIASIKEFAENFVLVIIGERDPKFIRVIERLRALDPIEIKAN